VIGTNDCEKDFESFSEVMEKGEERRIRVDRNLVEGVRNQVTKNFKKRGGEGTTRKNYSTAYSPKKAKTCQ